MLQVISLKYTTAHADVCVYKIVLRIVQRLPRRVGERESNYFHLPSHFAPRRVINVISIRDEGRRIVFV